MKKLLGSVLFYFTCFALVIILILLASGCSSQAPSPTSVPKPTVVPSPTTAPSPIVVPSPTLNPPPSVIPQPTATASPAKPITLRFSSFNPPMASNSQAIIRWADKIDKESSGRLKLQLYFGESLAKATEIYRATQSGVTDIGYSIIGTDVSITPLSAVTRIPFLGIPSMPANGLIFWDLYKKFPEIQREWQGMKPLVVLGLPPLQFHFTKKDVRLPADIKGMKIIARGEWPEVVKSMEAVPVDLQVGDWYTGLERGLVEGHISHFLAADTFKLLPLYAYNLILGDGGANIESEMYMININSWNSLPPDLQKILGDSTAGLADDILKTNSRLQIEAIEKTKGLNKSFYYCTPDEIKVWQETGQARIKSWIPDNVAKGLPAQAVYDEVQKLIKQYASVK